MKKSLFFVLCVAIATSHIYPIPGGGKLKQAKGAIASKASDIHKLLLRYKKSTLIATAVAISTGAAIPATMLGGSVAAMLYALKRSHKVEDVSSTEQTEQEQEEETEIDETKTDETKTETEQETKIEEQEQKAEEVIDEEYFMRLVEQFKLKHGFYIKDAYGKDFLEEINKQLFVDMTIKEKGIVSFYSQSLKVPINSKIIVTGDIHADIDSLNANIKDWEKTKILNKSGIVQDSYYLVFLGDLADRGCDSIGVWREVMKLKINNPKRVILLRGNHEEDLSLVQYGTFEKWINSEKWNGLNFLQFVKVFDYLPHVLFIQQEGRPEKTLMFMHGGVTRYYDPSELLGKVTDVKTDELIS